MIDGGHQLEETSENNYELQIANDRPRGAGWNATVTTIEWLSAPSGSEIRFCACSPDTRVFPLSPCEYHA
jgi:hypothetical protein